MECCLEGGAEGEDLTITVRLRRLWAGSGISHRGVSERRVPWTLGCTGVWGAFVATLPLGRPHLLFFFVAGLSFLRARKTRL